MVATARSSGVVKSSSQTASGNSSASCAASLRARRVRANGVSGAVALLTLAGLPVAGRPDAGLPVGRSSVGGFPVLSAAPTVGSFAVLDTGVRLPQHTDDHRPDQSSPTDGRQGAMMVRS
jgi:hypothetical protein